MTHSSPAALPPSALTQRTSDAVPREVLTWLQALGLGSAVKNVKRDLSNGCVLAQICAHYWDQVPLHSFNNGVGAASKQSNWYVLQKMMRRHGVEVSPTMVRGMVDGVDDCAVAFLKQLYTVFTGRVMEETPVPLAEPLVGVPDKDIPAFAPANANSAAARARHAADGGTSFSGVLGASTSMAASRYGGGGRADRAFSFGMGGTSATSAAAAGAGGATRAVPASLPPLMPPPPVEAPFAAAAVASGKPALNVAVRPAGQVSTVLPSAAAAAASESDSYLAGGMERGVASTGLPMGTALATTWFSAKVRDALPTEVAETIHSANRAAADAGASNPSTISSLTATLAWLSAPDGAYDADVVYTGEGEESVRESQAEVRQRVWRLLLASAHDLATLVLHCSPHGLDVLVDHLFSAVRDTTLCTAAGEEKPAGVAFARNAAQFCAALLMHLSDADVHAALRCFQTCLLTSDAFAAALRGVRWCVAKEYAAVVVAALPPNRAVAATVLESLWTSLEDVVRDASDAEGEKNEKDMSPEVSLVVLVHALLQTLLPLHTGAAAAAQKRTSPPTANSMASAGLTSHAAPDGTRPTSSAMARRKSQRTRSTHAAAAAAAMTSGTGNGAAMEENMFDAVVVRLAHQRCADALLHVSQAPSLFSSTHASDSTVQLVEAAAALAVDLLRVEVRTPLVRRLASGDDLLDVYHVLFGLFDADSESGASSERDVPEEDAAAAAAAVTTAPLPPLRKKRSVLMQHPALAVLRARWLRWCLQRRWQYCLSSRTSTPGVAAVPFPCLGGSMGGLSDTEALQAVDKEAWGGGGEMEEERALRRGLQVVCAELFSSVSGEEADAAVGGEAPEDVATRLTAKVLMACTMAEALPFLPAQYKSLAKAVAGGAAPGSSEAGGGPVNVYNTHGGENDGDGVGNPTRTLQQQYQQSEAICAEAVAEAVLHVLMREASTAQVRALLRSPSSATPTTPLSAVSAQEATVTLMHAVVGPLTSPGALVLRGDVLLLVKAMLCVLDTLHASSLKGPAVEKEVAVVARRLGARAAVMAREGQVEESLRCRIGWMHALLVEGRRLPPPPTAPSIPTQTAAAAADTPPPLLTGDDAATAQWHAIILDCWDTFMVVLQAATLRLRQRGGTAVAAAAAAASGSSETGQVDPALLLDAIGESLLICAQQSQEVVRCLERELSSVLPGRGAAATAAASMATEMNASATGKSEGVTLNSALLSGPVASFVPGTSAEEVQAAVGWMWTVVAGS